MENNKSGIIDKIENFLNKIFKCISFKIKKYKCIFGIIIFFIFIVMPIMFTKGCFKSVANLLFNNKENVIAYLQFIKDNNLYIFDIIIITVIIAFCIDKRKYKSKKIKYKYKYKSREKIVTDLKMEEYKIEAMKVVNFVPLVAVIISLLVLLINLVNGTINTQNVNKNLIEKNKYIIEELKSSQISLDEKNDITKYCNDELELIRCIDDKYYEKEINELTDKYNKLDKYILSDESDVFFIVSEIIGINAYLDIIGDKKEVYVFTVANVFVSSFLCIIMIYISSNYFIFRSVEKVDVLKEILNTEKRSIAIYGMDYLQKTYYDKKTRKN